VVNAPTRPLSVLIVDDNAEAAFVLARLVELHGHAARVEHDGAAGLRAAEQSAPDVCLLDLILPGMDGWELARRLRGRLGAGPLLVAVTGYGTERDRTLSRQASFDHHFLKPIDARVLADLLQTRARRPQLSRTPAADGLTIAAPRYTGTAPAPALR
jgi:CheY-like chemotaxis protein